MILFAYIVSIFISLYMSVFEQQTYAQAQYQQSSIQVTEQRSNATGNETGDSRVGSHLKPAQDGWTALQIMPGFQNYVSVHQFK